MRYAFLVRLRRPLHAAAGLLATVALSLGLAGCESGGISRTVHIAERPIWTAGNSWTSRGRGPNGAYTVPRKVLKEGTFEGRYCYQIEAGAPPHLWTRKPAAHGRAAR